MKYCLCLNASGIGVSGAIMGEGGCISFEDFGCRSEEIPSVIKQNLEKNNIKWQEIAVFASARGPGSTIGLRSAIAIGEAMKAAHPSIVLMAPDIFQILNIGIGDSEFTAILVTGKKMDKYLYRHLEHRSVFDIEEEWVKQYDDTLLSNRDDQIIFDSVSRDVLEIDLMQRGGHQFVFLKNESSIEPPKVSGNLTILDQKEFIEMFCQIVWKHKNKLMSL